MGKTQNTLIQQENDLEEDSEFERIKASKLKDEKAIANLKEKIPEIEELFHIHRRIGNGTFSTVFLATLQGDKAERKKTFAIKHLIPTCHPNRIEKELKCLLEIGGSHNVVGVEVCLRRRESVAFVMPYLPHDNFPDYFDKMDLQEVKCYIKNLLIALRHVHSFNIIHRDVKPSNFLHDRKTGKFMLVDFGLAQNVVSLEKSLNQLEQKLPSSAAVLPSSPSQSTRSKRKRGSSDNVSNENSKVRRLSYPFKEPLKQLNEQIRIKSALDARIDCQKNHPLVRQIHSEVSPNLIGRSKQRLPISSVKESKQHVNYLEKKSIISQTNINISKEASVPPSCRCYGKNTVCNNCIVKQEIPASRAGTPGYRPPEVLLKHTDQTTAVDVWAVGVIFLSILSGVYPFFKAPDDFVALAEIITLFGDKEIKQTAAVLERRVSISRKCHPINLDRLCVRLRNRAKIKLPHAAKTQICSNCRQLSLDCICLHTGHELGHVGDDMFPSSAYWLLYKLLETNPYNRITADEALKHPFFEENS